MAKQRKRPDKVRKVARLMPGQRLIVELPTKGRVKVTFPSDGKAFVEKK